MLYRFFEDTLVSRMIKNLLRTTAIPCFKIAEASDYLIEGRCYIYKGLVIRCEKSGYFEINPLDNLYPSDLLFPSDGVFPGVIPEVLKDLGKYKVLRYYNPEDDNDMYNYHSKEMWYDSDTHYQLGEYLRYLKHSTGLNLMPYYNCFNYKSTLNLKPEGINKKNLLVPVKYNRTYTICLNSNTAVKVSSIIYNTYLGNYTHTLTSKKYLSRSTYSNTAFNKPFLITVGNPDSLQAASCEKDLYLNFEIDSDNNTGLVVLEGNYLNSNRSSITSYPHFYDPINLSLMKVDNNISYAFSSRLVEYLLLHVITELDPVSDNIKRVQKQITELKIKSSYSDELLFADYSTGLTTGKYTYGIWDEDIKGKLKTYIDYLIDKGYPLVDQDGNINSQLEEYLRRGVK